LEKVIAVKEGYIILYKELLLNLEEELHLYLSLEKIQPKILKQVFRGIVGSLVGVSSLRHGLNTNECELRSKNIRLAVRS
jgi:hypothetical protein